MQKESSIEAKAPITEQNEIMEEHSAMRRMHVNAKLLKQKFQAKRKAALAEMTLGE